MGTTRIQVCNQALAHLGIGKRIADVDERSAEAEALKLFYEDAVDELLRDHDWPFARKKAALVEVTDSTDDAHPDANWTYAYRYPADCLKALRIDSGVRTDYRQARVSFDLMADTQGTLIMCDKEEAELEYSSTDARNPARWNSDFALCLAYRLAAYIAPMLTKGDPFKIGQVSMTFFRMSRSKAEANAANEVQPDEDPDSPLILSRL